MIDPDFVDVVQSPQQLVDKKQPLAGRQGEDVAIESEEIEEVHWLIWAEEINCLGRFNNCQDIWEALGLFSESGESISTLCKYLSDLSIMTQFEEVGIWEEHAEMLPCDLILNCGWR